MMLNIKKYSTVCLSALLLAGSFSCEDRIELDPISTVSSENFWQTTEDALAGTIAIYDGLQGTYNNNHIFWGELRGDNFDLANDNSTNAQSELVLNTLQSTANVARWTRLYNTISRANIALNRLEPLVESGIADEGLMGEAYAIRAKLYFDAIRVWGNVPLIRDGSSALDLGQLSQPAVSPTTVLEQSILPDIQAASIIMQRQAVQSDPFRFTLSSLLCLQAEVAMWTRDYQAARTAVNTLINLGTHSLVTSVEDYVNMFANETPGVDGNKQFGSELIYSIPYSISEPALDPVFEDQRPGGRAIANNANRSGIKNTFNAGGTQVLISIDAEIEWRTLFPVVDTLWNALYPDTPPVLTEIAPVTQDDGSVVMEEVPIYGDWRYLTVREDGTELSPEEVGGQRMVKHGLTVGAFQTDDTDINIYRYADMLLLLAEAENFLNPGDGTAALAIVNQIREARMLPMVTPGAFGADVSAREDFILRERRFELFGEGKRWWDLARTNRVVETLNPRLDPELGGFERGRPFEGLTGNDNLTRDRGFELFPIFQNHLRDNLLLEQNPAYQ